MSSVYLDLRIKVRNNLPLPVISKPEFSCLFFNHDVIPIMILHVFMDFTDTLNKKSYSFNKKYLIST